LQTFAEQAVIAIGSVATFRALRERTAELAQRQNELRVTFENMGDGVAMFDEAQRLVAWNRRFQDIIEVPDDVIARRRTFSEYVRYLAERGEYGPNADPEEQVRRLTETVGHRRAYERTRPNGAVVEIRNNPVADGGFVVIYADITERKRAEEALRTARDAAETALRDLRIAQASLIQAEKMASLGQLTAGIAHEIKNPLNFVNNFASLSVELLGELKDAVTAQDSDEIEELSATLASNLQKIEEHGRRADGIVRGMLEHSRGSTGERRAVDLNALVDEALNLAYHGARAQDQGFNITLERDFASGIPPITLAPQDITRVLLNLCSNGFYAARKREGTEPGFTPVLRVTTRDLGDAVEIKVRDNGVGVPPDVKDKLFQPFFTTKPAGEGTGLGLSITYDIVTKQHGGAIAVDSEVDEFTEFTITLPRQVAATGERP
jgi:signal transduction histidine kinase